MEKIGVYCDIISGYAFKASDLKASGDVPIVKIGNISNRHGIIFDSNTQYVDNALLSINNKYHIQNGDILISLTGSHINQPNSMVGRCCRNTSNILFLLNQRAGKAIPKTNVDKDYLYHLFCLDAVKFSIANMAYGGANQVNVSPKDIMKIRWEFPLISVQQKIASILSTYDTLIENNTKRIRLLGQMAENLYKEWFVRFRYPGYEKSEMENGVPKDWKKERLGNFLKFERGVGYGSKDIESGDYTLLSMNNIKPYGGFIPDYSRPFSGKFKEFQLLKENDLIMSITDMTQDRRIIGYVGIVPPGPANRVICTHLIKISSSLYGSFFLNGLFNYSGLSRVIAERATGTNVLGMTADILKKVKCILPDHSLIERYESIAQKLFTEKFKLEEQNSLLIRQRDLLLPRLMSGKLEVTV